MAIPLLGSPAYLTRTTNGFLTHLSQTGNFVLTAMQTQWIQHTAACTYLDVGIYINGGATPYIDRTFLVPPVVQDGTYQFSVFGDGIILPRGALVEVKTFTQGITGTEQIYFGIYGLSLP